MKKTVCFVGGIHGAGKSTISKLVAIQNEWLYTKQKYLIVDIAKGLGALSWSDSSHWFFNSIEMAGRLLLARLSQLSEQVAIVDCHYAIRTEKALRLQNSYTNYTNRSYIADLDRGFVNTILCADVKVKFVYMEVDPLLAASRCIERSIDHLDYEYTYQGLLAQDKAERQHFMALRGAFNVPPEDACSITNESLLEDATHQLTSFIKKSF